MTSEIAFLKIRLLPSQGKFRTRLELMAAVNTKETLKELLIEISKYFFNSLFTIIIIFISTYLPYL